MPLSPACSPRCSRTPCSAPFVGTALGFALAGGPAEIVTIFAALGVGLALPYLAVCGGAGPGRLAAAPGPLDGAAARRPRAGPGRDRDLARGRARGLLRARAPRSASVP
ncbi:MAG: hypothetical protein WDO24_28790 [Pseudomonadota bacterium]